MGASAVIRYLIDANIVSFWLEGTNRALVHRIRERRAQAALSPIILHELYFGAFNGKQTNRNLANYDRIELPLVPFEREDARVAGEIRESLRRTGTPIGPYDILIAGQALARDLTLVTNNTREFARVEGLRLEDWTTA